MRRRRGRRDRSTSWSLRAAGRAAPPRAAYYQSTSVPCGAVITAGSPSSGATSGRGLRGASCSVPSRVNETNAMPGRFECSLITNRMPSRCQPTATYSFTHASSASSVTGETSTNLYTGGMSQPYQRSALRQQLGGVERVIRDDDVRAGSSNAGEGFEEDALAIDPAALGG